MVDKNLDGTGFASQLARKSTLQFHMPISDDTRNTVTIKDKDGDELKIERTPYSDEYIATTTMKNGQKDSSIKFKLPADYQKDFDAFLRNIEDPNQIDLDTNSLSGTGDILIRNINKNPKSPDLTITKNSGTIGFDSTQNDVWTAFQSYDGGVLRKRISLSKKDNKEVLEQISKLPIKSTEIKSYLENIFSENKICPVEDKIEYEGYYGIENVKENERNTFKQEMKEKVLQTTKNLNKKSLNGLLEIEHRNKGFNYSEEIVIRFSSDTEGSYLRLRVEDGNLYLFA